MALGQPLDSLSRPPDPTRSDPRYSVTLEPPSRSETPWCSQRLPRFHGRMNRARPFGIRCPLRQWRMVMIRTTNSAGFSGAKPTSTFKRLAAMSAVLCVVELEFAKYASRGRMPWNAPLW
jgi:hypothetical protein